MKFTIVTPSFNKGEHIQKTIESVLKQQQPGIDIEYFIFDNFSTDNTISILKGFSLIPNIDIYQRKDLGQFDAINQGWINGTGEILSWLNADDIYYEGVLAEVAEFFQSNADVMAIYGESVYIDSNNEKLKQVSNIRDYSKRKLLSHDFITQPSTFIRREVFEEIGLLSGQYRYVFDWEYWIRISKTYDFVRVPFIISGYRITGTNLTSTGKDKRFREMIHLVWRYGGIVAIFNFLLRLLIKYSYGFKEIPTLRKR